MGLCNVPATFPIVMISIFYDYIDDFIFIYLDDIFFFSNTKEKHIRYLRMVLLRLHSHKLYLEKQKVVLIKKGTECLGLRIGKKESK